MSALEAAEAISQRQRNIALVEASFAVQMLQEVVHQKWICGQSNAQIRAWLDDNIVDAGLPVWLPM